MKNNIFTLSSLPVKIASNKIADMVLFYREQLHALYDAGELHAIIELAFYRYLGFSKTEVLTRQNENLNQSDVLKLYDCCKALARGVPVQYALGVAEFYGLDLKVNPSVLIPRPETEELVDLVVKEERGKREDGRWKMEDGKGKREEGRGEDGRDRTKDEKYKTQDERHKTQDASRQDGRQKAQEIGWQGDVREEKKEEEERGIRILDIGTGSGCIPIALKKHMEPAEVFAIDISEEALETAKDNARRLGADVTFAQADLLGVTVFFKGIVFDLVISNPPYIKKEEAAAMAPQVLDFEPALALFVNDADSIVFYKKIIDLCKSRLADEGSLWLELNPLTAKAVETYAMQAAVFKNIELISDLSGKERFLKASK